MIFVLPVTLLLAAQSALAAPAAPEIDDTVILNYALTLEHLENTFYREGLAKFDDQAFQHAGYPPFVRRRFLEIGQHEASHVETLTSVLGDAAVQPCKYSFPYDDPASFVAFSQLVEGVGAGAYTGAAPFIENKDYLLAAASILATEARHAAWVASAVYKKYPYSDAFETPLTFNQVFSLAASFIESCPTSNPTLPFQAFPALTLSGKKIAAGQTARVSYESSAETAPEGLSVAFLRGLNTEYAPVKDGMVKIPKDLEGTVYAVLVNGTTVTDETTLAGPAVLQFPF